MCPVMPKIILLSPSLGQDGNHTTAKRIHSYYSQVEGVDCTLVDASRCHGELEGDLIVALHAWHSAQILLRHDLPFVLIFGGTDLNHYSASPQHRQLMAQVVARAKFLVTFSSTMTRKAFELWPTIAQESVRQIPQGVFTAPSKFSLKNHLHLNPASKTLLLLAGVRPVKDPLYLVEAFSRWQICNPSFRFVILGANKNEEFYGKVKKVLKDCPGVYLVEEVSLADAHAAIRESFALVNSSVSEGMPSAILEAMDLNTPVVARDIPGNRDLVKDRVNGLVYRTPHEFVKCIEELMSDDTLRSCIVDQASRYVRNQHDLNKERMSYQQLLKYCI